MHSLFSLGRLEASATTSRRTSSTTTSTKPTAAPAAAEPSASTSPSSIASTGEASPATAITPTSRASAATSCTHTRASWLLDLGRTWWGLGLRQEFLQRQQLVATNEELVTGLETRRLDPFLRLDGEIQLVDRPEDLVDLAHGRFVLQVDGRVEVGDLRIDGAAHHLALGRVHELSHFCSRAWSASMLVKQSSGKRVGVAYLALTQEDRMTGSHLCLRESRPYHHRERSPRDLLDHLRLVRGKTCWVNGARTAVSLFGSVIPCLDRYNCSGLVML